MIPRRYVKKSITKIGPDFLYERIESGVFSNGIHWAIFYDSSWKIQYLRHPYVYVIALGSTDALFGMYSREEALDVIDCLTASLRHGEKLEINPMDVFVNI
jgi:hypothetical protein